MKRATRWMLRGLFTGPGLVAWVSTMELYRNARAAEREAASQLSAAILRNEDAIRQHREARSILQESL